MTVQINDARSTLVGFLEQRRNVGAVRMPLAGAVARPLPHHAHSRWTASRVFLSSNWSAGT